MNACLVAVPFQSFARVARVAGGPPLRNCYGGGVSVTEVRVVTLDTKGLSLRVMLTNGQASEDSWAPGLGKGLLQKLAVNVAVAA